MKRRRSGMILRLFLPTNCWRMFFPLGTRFNRCGGQFCDPATVIACGSLPMVRPESAAETQNHRLKRALGKTVVTPILEKLRSIPPMLSSDYYKSG